MTEFEKNCYGCSERDLLQRYGYSLELAGKELFVGGILSDVQEMVERDYDKDEIRKTLNVAKFFLFRSMKEAA